MKVVLRVILGSILLGVFGYTLWYLYAKSQEKPQVAITEKPFVSDIIVKTVATGSVVPRKEVEVKPNISGIIKEVYVEAGQKVKAGDIIAKVRIVPNLERLTTAESRVDRAAITLENAKLDYDRNYQLYKDQVISKATFQPFEVALKSAQEEAETAQDNLDIIRDGATKDSKSTTNTLIRATVGGMVLDVPVKEGNSVIEANNFNEGTTIASIADMQDMIFEGKVDESEVGKLREGMRIILKVGAIENTKFNAELNYIAPKGIEENGAIQFEIKANVKLDTSSFIRAGYSANGDIVLDRVDSVICINESLLKFEDKEPYVEVQTGGDEFEKRTVVTGLSDGINTEIKEGVSLEDEIKAGMIDVEEMEKKKGRRRH
ncbi:MAG: efflux transporter periplasmic adaptor subunit [Crocinitomicaceae bacterium]|mgnify:CR=1 FL=1|nr:efflux transporter periplasmic adaptor subunit [Crocinitomicaceae bacterium]|tara:strand:- start:22673 stop:23797 length:1125 start_codon:yes stop_codon:yes gene_type:complete